MTAKSQLEIIVPPQKEDERVKSYILRQKIHQLHQKINLLKFLRKQDTPLKCLREMEKIVLFQVLFKKYLCIANDALMDQKRQQQRQQD